MKLKGAGFIPFCAVLIFLSSAFSEKLVEVSTAITKLRFLPSASSDTRGFARKGQRFVVDGESGQWFRIRLYNSTVWIAKDAVSVLESSEPPPAAAPDAPAPVTAQTQPGTQAPYTPRPATVPTPPAATPRSLPGQTPQPGFPVQPPAMSAETLKTIAAIPESARTAIAAAQQGLNQAQPAETAAAPAAVPARPARPTFQVAEPAPAKPKKPLRQQPRSTWFSQFSRMPQVPSGEEGKEIAFFQAVTKDALVLYAPLDGGTVLARIKKGDYFPVLDSSGKWCRIAFADTAGWVERGKGIITTAPSSGIVDELMLILIIATLVAAGAIIAVIVLVARRRNKNKAKAEPFRSLIIAKRSPDIQAVISNKTISLEKYLSAIGFSVKILHNPEGGQHFIEKFQPDVAFIDWNISSDIPGTVEILFAGFDEKKLPLTIFFNVPDLSDIPLIPVLLRAYHLGVQFSDHDISKLITPTMLSRSSTKAPAASALEGDIAEGNLPEILQFIEIGKKNGCLLIDTDSPVGMIYFEQGRIIHAAAVNGIMGRDAIYLLLGLKQGHFRFLLNKQPKTSDLNLSTLEVLMEWTKTVDEAHRN